MGAKSALRGYRTQFLYSLYRILLDYDKEYIFDVEGDFEDLDILDNKNNYIEVIQVKNKTGVLSFSDLFSKKDSFFKRSLRLINQSENAKIKIVSFSKVSDELIDINKLKKKLKKKKFKDNAIESILLHYQKPEIVDELELTNKILTKLKETNLFTDSKVALELLLFWVYKSGEKQNGISGTNLIDDLNGIGKFLSEKTALHSHFGNTIIPLNSKSIDATDINQLGKGFYYGISANYEHILANLDVVRTEKLDLINNAFNKNNIVFIQGASGQGKSTLAYRYLHDFLDDNAVYELKISANLNEVYEIINSLNSLCKGLKFPITVYFDVQPQYVYWNEILKELSNKTNLHFLITIRQEDWNRTILGDEFDFEEIELEFNKIEAKNIYNSLSEYKTDLKFTDFEESWLSFGNSGMLLEYIYLINQGDKLKIRLQNQIKRLEQEKKIEELQILRYVCLSDSYNSKINYQKIIETLNIEKVLSNSFIELLEKEYLLKHTGNKKYLTGLHPIRSQILCEILFEENDYIDVNDYISNTISLIDEKDVHFFLLNSFKNGFDINKLLKELENIQFSSWTGYNNIANALLWKGVSDFIFQKNIKTFDTLYNDYKGFWDLLLPYDYSEVMKGSFHNSISSFFPDDANENIKKLIAQFSPKVDVFEYLNKWLNNKNVLSVTNTIPQDINHLGNFLFWIGYLKFNTKIQVIIDEKLITNLTKNISIEESSILILGLKYYNYESKEFLNKLEQKNINRLREKFNITYLKINKKISCTYFYDLINFKDSDTTGENIFNKMSMDILDILRNIFPFKSKYKIQGKNILDFEYTDSSKNIKRKNLPIQYLVQINVLINNLYSYQFRPTTWQEYSLLIKDKRDTYSEFGSSLINAFVEYFRTNNYSTFVNVISKIENELKMINKIHLPQNISDEWGYISEGKGRTTMFDINENNSDEIQLNKTISLVKYKSYTKSQRGYFSSLDNFFNQIGDSILSVYKIRSGVNEEGEEDVERKFRILISNIKESFLNYNSYYEEFNIHFLKFHNKIEIKKLHNKEDENLITLFYSWKQFLYQQGKVNLKLRKNAVNSFLKTKDELTKRFKKEQLKTYNETGLSYTISTNDTNTDKILFLTCEVDFEIYHASWMAARQLVREILNADYFSFKKIIIDLNITSVVFIPLFNEHPINQAGIEIIMYNLDEEDDDNWHKYLNPLYTLKSKNIKYLKLDFWNNKVTEIKDYENVLGEIVSINIISKQIEELRLEKMDIDGNKVLTKYIYNNKIYFSNRLNKTIQSLENIKQYLNNEDFYNEIKRNIENVNLLESKDELIEIQQNLSDNFYSFSEMFIYL